ncbi:CCA tRNA nucleotidyltransferase, mitochondrial [Smittium culicis]|uniref:CCA tRNA nucleotidyltransferase, mitochondrial n=1 Tax=Smittium culicis TaxID=133412 RepID=A0A1R1XVY8_9FUNG|nr:CCA tRNA nucleotidyltransferase, mitochondrial [Smittium culicis]
MQNPEKSKHLETATTTIFGNQIDFVNLRCESYNENSRIPETIEFGTPLQDALRRDITINSLFYNISSNQVEDYIEKGLDDLKNGIIRTPIDPFITFSDDPLRVLRVFRFASRFGFNLVPEISSALKDEGIKADFGSKISKERIGDELIKMLDGKI